MKKISLKNEFPLIYLIFIIHYVLNFINASEIFKFKQAFFISYGILLVIFNMTYLIKIYRNKYIPILNKIHYIIIIYVIYNIILLTFSFIEVKNITDRNILIAFSPSFFHPLFVLLFVYWKTCIYYIIWILKYILPFICIANIFLLITQKDCHANYIIYVIYFTIFFYKYQNRVTKNLIVFTIATSLVSCFINIDRAAILYIFATITCYLLSNIININHLKILRFSIFFPTIFLLFNAYNNTFTTLNKNDKDFLYDTRTFLYQDITNHLDKHNAIIWGTTPAIKYQSSLKNSYYVSNAGNSIEAYKIIKEGRMNSESQFANIIHWGGVIYLILTTFLYWEIISYSINHVKNSIGISLILFIIMRFFFMYIEGLQTILDQSITLWVATSLVINVKFVTFKENTIHYIFKT